MNIWTHFLGAAAFVAAGFTPQNNARASSSLKLGMGDTLAFGISITAAAVCFGLSATFHTLRGHSYNIHHLLARWTFSDSAFSHLEVGCPQRTMLSIIIQSSDVATRLSVYYQRFLQPSHSSILAVAAARCEPCVAAFSHCLQFQQCYPYSTAYASWVGMRHAIKLAPNGI